MLRLRPSWRGEWAKSKFCYPNERSWLVYKRIHHLAGEKKYWRHVNRLQNSGYGHHSATWASQVLSSAMALPTPTFPASPKIIQSHIESPFLPQAFSYFSSRLLWSTSLKSFRNHESLHFKPFFSLIIFLIW
jgi:hypothetical protein